MTAYVEIKPGDWVKAFHPRMLGVIKHARVKSVTSKHAQLDFGLSGTFRTPRGDITEIIRYAEEG